MINSTENSTDMSISQSRIALTLATAAAASLILGSCSGGGSAAGDDSETHSFTLATNVPTGGLVSEQIVHWADLVEERTDGRITFDIFDSGTLLTGTDIIPGIEDGRVEAGHSYSVYHPGELPAFSIAGLPWVTSDSAAVARAMYDMYHEDTLLTRELDSRGVTPLMFTPIGAAALGTTSPLESIDQLNGTRIRVTGDYAVLNDAVGAESAYIDFGETFDALSRGLMDGWDGSEWSVNVDAGMHEATPYFNHPQFGTAGTAAVLISTAEWEAISEEDRAAISAATEEFYDWVPEKIVEHETESCDRLWEEGGEAHMLPEDEIEEWESRVGDSAFDKLMADGAALGYSEEEVTEFRDQYVSVVAAMEEVSGYEDGFAACADRN